MSEIPAELLRAIHEHERFVLTGHRNPDGDSVGCGLALQRSLRSLGKEALVWNRDPAPRDYAGLPGVAEIHTGEEPPAGFPEAFDLAWMIECPTLERSGLADSLARLPQINLDHHLGNDGYGIAQWVDPEAPALGEMVLSLLDALGVEPDVTTWNLLLLTLVTDTGGFRFSNADRRAFTAARELVDRGARPEIVSQWVYESQTEGAVRLLGESLRSLELHAGGRVASLLVTREMMERAGAQAGDTEGLVDRPRSIGGVEAVVLLREIGPDHYKISLRSRGEVDVQAIARDLGGGGHHNAAGAQVKGALPELRSQLTARLERALETR